MKTSLKVILTAMTVAVLASPVMAQPESHPHAASASISHAHGSAARTHAGQLAPVESNQVHVDDCVHVAFPQCTGGN